MKTSTPLFNRAIRVIFTRSELPLSRDWTLTVHLGRGAGYIGGASLWIANAANSQIIGFPAPVRRYQQHFSFGVTRNWNRLPYVRA